MRYLAPELTRGARPDERAELYALGLVYYEMLAGRSPFTAATAADMARAHQEVPPPPLPADVPPRVSRLVMRLLDKDPDARPRVGEVIAELSAEVGEQPFFRAWGTLGTSRLEGREEHLASFDAVVDALAGRDGGEGGPRPRTILMTGPPGIGKTRLVSALKHRAQVAGLRFVSALCKPDSDAFSAARALLRPLVQERPDLITPEREVLRMVLSDRTMAQSVHQAGSMTLRRAMVRLYDAARSLIEAFAREQPLVVVLEDLHWADPETMDWFRHLARHLRGRVLSVGTSWPPGQSQAALDQLLAELPLASGEARWIEVEGLKPRAVRTLVQRYLGVDDPPEDLMDAIYKQTNGNPLFIEEILKSAGSTAGLRKLIEGHHLPRAVGEAFRAQILALSPKSLTALKGLAVWGTPASSLDIASVTLQDRVACLEGIEDAADCQILANEGGGYWFKHNVLVQIVLESMSEDELRSMHRRAGIRLEAQGSTSDLDRIGRLVTHFTMAGETTKALGYALSGARTAQKQYLARRAVELYEKAQELSLEVLGHAYGGTAGLTDLKERLAHLYAWTGAYESARREAEDLLNNPGIANDRRAMVRVRNLLGDIALRRGDTGLALEHFQTALQSCAPGEDAAKILARIADVHLRRGRPSDAEKACNEALEHVRTSEAAQTRADIVFRLGKSAQEKSDYARALEYYVQARRLYDEARYTPGVASAIQAIGQVYHYQDQYPQAQAAFLDALELQEQLGDVEGVAQTLERLALATWGMLDTQKALVYCRRALSKWRRLGNAQGEARTLQTLGLIYHFNADYREVLECSEAALELQRRVGDRAGLLVSYQNLAILYYELGALDLAQEAADKALALAGQSDSKLRTMRCHHILGVVASARGEVDTARRELQFARQMAIQVGNKERLSDILCALGENELRAGNVDGAARLVDQAMETVASLGESPLQLQVQFVAARVALARNGVDLKPIRARLEAITPKKGVHISPDLMWQLWEIQGCIALETGRPREACRHLMRSMEILQACYQRIPPHLQKVYLADPRRQAVRKALDRAIRAIQQNRLCRAEERNFIMRKGAFHERQG